LRVSSLFDDLSTALAAAAASKDSKEDADTMVFFVDDISQRLDVDGIHTAIAGVV
jgi:hypothetical protein